MTKVKAIKKINNFSSKFFHSWISFFTLILIISIFWIIQLILFIFGKIYIAGTNDYNNLIPWIYLSISLPATLLSMIGYIYTVRVNKKFFVPTLISQIINLFIFAIGGAMWTAICMIFLILSSIIRFNIISKNGTNYKIDTEKVIKIGMLISIIFMIIGLFFANFEFTNKIWWRDNDTRFLRIFDVISSSFVILGSFSLISKHKSSFAIFLFCNFLFFVLFSITQLWLNLFQMIIYILFNITALLAWSNKNHHQKNLIKK